ncbi:hypothetical protein QTJ16_006101 [Diplocarpon rosae]|uniref:Diels-Alderase n=1 Tax=Diplocarpon rosae TaxID=946125 RepID=A0AAD9SUN0_9HELO|nr:hypothetical protein QTJ16_006101 [Diplocarpon rosae]
MVLVKGLALSTTTWKLLLPILCAHGAPALEDSSPVVPDGWAEAEVWDASQSILGSEATEACEVSHVTAFEMAKGRHPPVVFSTSADDYPEMPRIVPSNSSAGEQWEFDAFSDDAQSGIIFGFYRDPTYSFLGSGNLRMYIEINGPGFAERFVQVDYPGQSTITHCPGRGTTGVWRDDSRSSGSGYSYSWEVSSDMSRARVIWDTPRTKGTLTLNRKGVSQSTYGDGSLWPTANASMMTSPHFYLFDPLPVAHATLEAVVDGQALKWSGAGGHTRLWNAFNWFTCLNEMLVVRFRTGPFALTMWVSESWLYRGSWTQTITLFENGEQVFRSQRTESSDEEDWFDWAKIYSKEDGGVAGSFKDKSTGLQMDLVSPSRGRQWSFIITYRSVFFEFFLGGGVGGTGYAATVVGGELGEQSQVSGVALVEGLQFPEKSLVLKRNYVE